MTIRNYTPYARPTYNGERRPVTYEGGEWLSELPRPNPILRTLLRLVTCVPCIIAVCVVAVEVGLLVRGGS